jgi:monoamine oxidase
MKKAKTQLLASLQKAFKISEISNKTSKSVSQLEEEIHSNYYSRREFINETAKAGLLIGAGSFVTSLAACKTQATENVKVAIIGAGIAGLNAAYQLKKKGIEASVFEADKKTGGRIFTKTDFISGYSTEYGGEFIDSSHEDMLQLVKELGLTTTDKFADKGLTEEAYFIDGKNYSIKEVIEEFKQVSGKIIKDKASLNDDYSNEASKKLDTTPMEEYIKNLGGSAWFTKLLNIAYASEYGTETSDQSAISFISMIGTESEEKFEIFGSSDERFKIVGGNSKLTEALTQRIKNQIRPEYKLKAIRQSGNAYTLAFENNKEIKADFVIITIPFTVLREVDIKVSGMTKEKRQCIDQLGYGTNAKLIMGFNKRIWRESGYNGYLFNETIQNGWDNSRMQNNNTGAGAFTCFVGGKKGLDFCNKQNDLTNKEACLNQLDIIFKNARANFSNKSDYARWPSNPFVKGSYAAYRVGQWTTIQGKEIEAIQNIFFAGEHCSKDYQGYMNGGAETGRRAAESVLAKMSIKA